MSNITSPTDQQSLTSSGKGKERAEPVDTPMDEGTEGEEEEEEEEDDDDDEEEEDNEMEEDDDEEEFEEIDPSAIVPRRTRGVRVDYTSKEALAKAGLTGNEDDDDDEDMN